MREIKLVLVADGAFDKALLPVIQWELRRQFPLVALADPAFEVRRGGLAGAIDYAVATHRPDIVFVHRDAESTALEVRLAEIPARELPLVRVVPVRMTEAWLLIDSSSIRRASGNPNGSTPIELPRPQRLEQLPNPKAILHDLLVCASELSGQRRVAQFKRDLGARAHLVAEYISDYSALDSLDAYRAFVEEVRRLPGELFLQSGGDVG